MIGGLTATGFAVLILLVLLFQGGTGRAGIVVAAMAGSAIALAGTLFDVLFSLADAFVNVIAQIGGAL